MDLINKNSSGVPLTSDIPVVLIVDAPSVIENEETIFENQNNGTDSEINFLVDDDMLMEIMKLSILPSDGIA